MSGARSCGTRTRWSHGELYFWKALQLNPNHCAGGVTQNRFRRLKTWFYGGFVKRWKLSKRRVSSKGQKLPKNWEVKAQEIISRVAGAQMPTPRPDHSFAPGVKDDDMGNMDHSPFYIEDHGNSMWGLRESQDRRCITTGGKDKSRFTAQLTIFKSGRKVCRSYLLCLLIEYSVRWLTNL